MELAIDTSTRVAGVALAEQGETLVELTWRADFNHTTQLLPAIEHILRLRDVKPADVNLVIIARGPGSFSGLRVGVSAAKGFALALGIPLVGVGTLWVEAYPFVGGRLPIRPILDAGRGDIATCEFSAPGGELLEAAAPSVLTIEELFASVREPTLFCGEHVPVVRDTIAQRLGTLAFFPPRSALLRRPGNLAELGWRRFSRGELDDPATLQPMYLRPPSITAPGPAQAPVRR